MNCDIKSLEVVVVADLANDVVLKHELRAGIDLHAENQARFKLPDRLTSKRFIFKLIYGATAYGYASDSDFLGVGYSEKRWQEVIDEFYNKYQGIAKWHDKIIHDAKEHGWLTIPSGRSYEFKAKKDTRGNWKWPITQIKNYPVQGFGADLMMLARVEFFQNFMRSGMEGCMIQTVHDSLVVDTPSENVYNVCVLLKEAVEAVPDLCRKHFNYDFSLPMKCELQTGMNKKELNVYDV